MRTNQKNHIMKRLNLNTLFATTILTSVLVCSCSNDDDNNSDKDYNASTALYASNNSDGNITIYDVTDAANISTKTLITSSAMADGIYYDATSDAVIQASRSELGLEGFSNISSLLTNASVSVDISGTNDMSSPREVAVNNNIYVVADNADVDGDATTPDGKLYIYTKSGNSFTLRNTIITDFKLWGITFNGNDLYAVVDATNELAVFNNFTANTSDTTLSASKRIAIEGITRTHGLTYDTASDIMIMTDIADAANGQDDGAFHIIEDFTSKFNDTENGATLAVTQQTRVAGDATLLGNPVDVAYDSETETIFIAEAGNGGGRILAFNNIGSGGNISPVVNNSLAAASSVFLSKK